MTTLEEYAMRSLLYAAAALFLFILKMKQQQHDINFEEDSD